MLEETIRRKKGNNVTSERNTTVNVLFDLTYIDPLSVSGIKNYAMRLVYGLSKIHESKIRILLLGTSKNHDYLRSLFPLYPIVKLNTTTISQGQKNFYLLNRLISRRALNKILKQNDIQTIVYPYLSYNSISTNTATSVGVVHDLQQLKITNSAVKRFLYSQLLKRALYAVTHIVTISKSTTEDLQYNYPTLLKQPYVIPNGIYYLEGKEGAFDYLKPYILNVNSLEPYKNLLTLLRSYGSISELIPHKLVIKSRKTPYWENIISPMISQLNLQSRVVLLEQNYTPEQMAGLYKGASLFVSPSTMEGFGYTPVEAGLQGTPVICANIPALYETTLGLVNYYNDPMDDRALATLILSVLNETSAAKCEHIKCEFMNNYLLEYQINKFYAFLLKANTLQ
jgi:glycosyltransferase involved in cell wall biosynthesis